MNYPKITRLELLQLLDSGWRFRGAGLYEPEHAPKETQFVIYPPVGLIRLVPPPEGKKVAPIDEAKAGRTTK